MSEIAPSLFVYLWLKFNSRSQQTGILITLQKAHPLQYIASFLLVAGTVILIVPTFSNISFPLRWSVNYLELYILALFVVGVVSFLFFRSNVLATVSLGCCFLLSFYLHHKTDGELLGTKTAEGPGSVVRVATFNTNSIGEDVRGTLERIIATQPDILLVQEIPPLYSTFIESLLPEDMRYKMVRPSIGLDGMAIYSRFDLLGLEEQSIEGCPFISCRMKARSDEDEFYLLTTHPQPVLKGVDSERLQRQLDSIQNYILQLDAPVLIGGDFNTVIWSNEMNSFRAPLELEDSRWGFSPTLEGNLNLWQPLMDHLLFGPEFHRLNFHRIDYEGTDVGVFAEFQLINTDAPEN